MTPRQEREINKRAMARLVWDEDAMLLINSQAHARAAIARHVLRRGRLWEVASSPRR